MTDREAPLRKLDEIEERAKRRVVADKITGGTGKGPAADCLRLVSVVRDLVYRHRPGPIGGTSGMTINGCIECRKPWPCADYQAAAKVFE